MKKTWVGLGGRVVIESALVGVGLVCGFWFVLVWFDLVRPGLLFLFFDLISEYLSCKGFKRAGMKSLNDYFLWSVDMYIGCDIIRRDGLVDPSLHRFWTRWVDRQQRFLAKSEGWRLFSEALDKCEQFTRDEDVMVVYVLFNADPALRQGASRALIERFASGHGQSAQDWQKGKGGVYPVEGQPSTFVAAAQAVLVKGRAFHCQIGLSKSDWLLRICEEVREGRIPRDSPEINPLWHGMAAPLFAWTCKTVKGHYGASATTCVCKNNIEMTNILWKTFRGNYFSLGSYGERKYCSAKSTALEREYRRMLADADALHTANGSRNDVWRRKALDEFAVLEKGKEIDVFAQLNRMMNTESFLNDTLERGTKWRLRTTPDFVVDVPSFVRQIEFLSMQVDTEIVCPWVVVMYSAARTRLPIGTGARLQHQAVFHQDTGLSGHYLSHPLASTHPPMEQPEDLQLLHATLESLHLRLCRLEAKTPLPFNAALENTKKALELVDKVVNYEDTIKKLVDDLNKIDGMCRQPNPDWLAIISEVLRVLSMEDNPKQQRDEDLILLVEKNLESLAVIDTVAGLVEQDRKLGVMVSLQSINDVRKTLDMVRDYEKTIKGIGMKYTLIIGKIKGLKWDIPTIISITLEIIQIIQEEDIAKKQREEHLLACVKKSTEALRDAAAHVSRAQAGVGIRAGLQAHLDSPFALVLGTLDTVLQGIDAVMNYQKTIDEICAKYEGVAASLQRLATITDIKQVIPCLLDFVQVLHEEDYAKLNRNAMLLENMKVTNRQIVELSSTLGNQGYTICSEY